MTVYLIYLITYVIGHSVYTIFEKLVNLLVWVRSCVYFNHGINLPDQAQCILHEVSKKNKTPKHITILLGAEEPSYTDLANLVIWSITTGIPYISFYDHKGVLGSNQHKLEEEIDIRKRDCDHIVWHRKPKSPYRNGYSGRKIHVKVLDEDDARESIVECAKHFVEQSKSYVDIELIDNKLREIFEFPDPDLGLYCGNSLCLYNYPPWQIRITEFFMIGSHLNITFKSFVEQLLLYSKCEQRLGK